MIVIHTLKHVDAHHILWLLEELELEYEVVSYGRGANSAALPPSMLRRLHPLGLSPVLQIEEQLIVGADAIEHYLLEEHDAGQAWRSEDARGEQRFWLNYAKHEVLNLALGARGDDRRVLLDFHLDYIEGLLGARTWLSGDTFSPADLRLHPFFAALESANLLGDREHIARLLAAHRERPGFVQACSRSEHFAPETWLIARALGARAGEEATASPPRSELTAQTPKASQEVFVLETLIERIAGLGLAVNFEAPPEKLRTKGERTRLGLAQSLLDLLGAGNPSPTVEQVAEGAGVSRRLVFHYYDSLDMVYAEAIQIHGRRMLSLYRPIETTLPLRERLDAFLEQRVMWLEEITPVRAGAVLRMHDSEVVRHGVEAGRALLRLDTQHTFSPELAPHDDALRGSLTAAVCAITSWSYWRALRDEQGLSSESARAIIEMTLTTLLEST